MGYRRVCYEAPMARRPDPVLRDHLLESAVIEFGDKGYAATSMDGVGRRTGVTKGGVYFHFRSKEVLFFAALDRARNDLSVALDQSASENEAPSSTGGAGKLRAFLARCLVHHFASPSAARVLRVLATELRGRFTAEVREDVRQAQRSLRARIREHLTTGTGDGSLFVEDVAQAAFLLAAAVEGILDQWLGSARDVESLCDPAGLAAALVHPLATGASVRPLPRRVDERADDLDYRPPF